ncbi:MAG: hypothetical protein ACI9TV_003081 [Sulfurimonas sp.]|jgi:hypothetical protein|uniref:flagellar hook-length control protein FliK n=1 Tax=Sulfurimonas sp. TaxID=2022749 RepID=UPI0039E5A9E8
MINISDFKQLGIILPNTNKALSKVISEATHQELKAITQGKDLKTVLSSLLKQSASTPESNRELLQLVKDNPTLKNLGNVTTTIKDLLGSLKSEKNPLPLEKVLQTFLSDVKDLKNSELKQKLENSGVILESKLKNVQNPQLELKNALISLVKNLQSSNSSIRRTIANEVKVLLNTEVLKSVQTPTIKNTPDIKPITNFECIKTANDNPKALQQLSTNVEKLISTLKTTLSKADSIHNPVITKALTSLEHKIEPKLLTPENFKLAPIKESLEQVSTLMSKSFTMESKSILASLEKILQVLKNVEPTARVPKASLESFLENKVPKMITNLSQEIKTTLSKTDSIHNPVITKALTSLEHKIEPKLLTPENFKLAPIKESLEQVSTVLSKSLPIESKSILASLEKILQVLKNVEPTATVPKTSLESFLENKVPKMITSLSQEIKEVIQKGEPIFHKDTTQILNKLETLNTAQKLHPQNNIKEMTTNDLKAVLLQASDEITKSNHPNQVEITKQIDKLSLQIDNYQLISHLSNGTSLYLPFSWDMMEEGNIEMKKSDDDKFYCDIYLKLKDYGEVNLKLTLYEKNQLNLHIYSLNEEFKSVIQDNIPMLRSALIDAQITPREIRVYEPKISKVSTSPYQQQEKSIYMGFEVKA